MIKSLSLLKILDLFPKKGTVPLDTAGAHADPVGVCDKCRP